MEQHGDIPRCPEPKCTRRTAPSGHRWLGVSGCRSCRQGMCNPIAMMVNRIFSDVEIRLGIGNAYDNRSPERGWVRGRDEVGGGGYAPCTVAPARPNVERECCYRVKIRHRRRNLHRKSTASRPVGGYHGIILDVKGTHNDNREFAFFCDSSGTEYICVKACDMMSFAHGPV